ncbi:PKD domain-containing protein [Paraflavitalea sp. CAU 1676]|uniref:PKD domain-containing protein n=1 Tax=Paraflavitalea sp. CAU 1676 TaxID=3032598 RepID=UPI0023DCB4C9|nr:PKD domain-containing protein [Paraflavitalea sp. CAU 1676]MDF2187501.1 PKD domain-containing protein [Paraflavitalea sp. CAU 1676]
MKNFTHHPWSKWYAYTIAALLFSFLSFTGSAQLVAKNLKAANGQSIGFYEYKPYDYNPALNPKYPLIIFLHGIGERGNGTTDLPSVLGNGTPAVIKAGHSMTFTWNGKTETFLVLIPQLSSSYGWWQTFYVDEMINYAKANLNVDPNRISLAGLSLGGGGTWTWAGASLSNAQTLNCIGVCCGTCENVNYSNYTNANLPVWAFHAKDDKTVSEGCSGGAIQGIEKLNPAVKPYYTVWPDGGHSVWGRAYDPGYSFNNPNIYEWFLGQNKSLPVNKRPVVNAGATQTVTVNSTVTLNASGSTDADGKLLRFIWTKKSGPNYGSIATPVTTNGITTVTGLVSAGTYVYEVKVVDDRADWTYGTVTINVVPGSGPNQAPTANAGNDLGLNQPNSVTTLNGSASVDPEGKMASYSWTQLSGPTTVAFVNANAASTNISNLTALGTYSFRLVVKDQEGLSGQDDVNVTVYGPNAVAIPDAGPDVVITLPTNSVTLDGSNSKDPDGKLNGFSWTKVTGPPDFTIASPNAAKTDVTGLVEGVYTFKLTVMDNLWIPATDIVQVTVVKGSGNAAPVAKAGNDITLTLPANNTTLNGLGSTDPNGNNTIASYKWTWVSGPSQYTLADANAGSTALSNLVAGTYVFSLTVTDNGGLSHSDQIQVIVNPAPPVNQAPVANAGTDIFITLPTNNTTLNGSASSDPDGNNTIATYKWAQLNGPAQFTLANANAASTGLSNLVEGTYTFELTVTDNGGLSHKDAVVVTVKPKPNQAPVANAGTDISITLPTNNTTLNGSASSDPDGNNTIATYKWAQLNGPTQFTVANANAASTGLSNLVEGTYTFELTVTDNGGLSHKDAVVVTVKPKPNQAPVANAGTDISITLPTNNTTLNGSASSDPDGNNTIATYKWAQLNGPAQFTLANANAASTGLSNLVEGTYTFELTVTDNAGLSHKDAVVVTVKPKPNQAPVANAGKDVNIVLPNNSTTLDGSGSTDPDGNNTIATYSWTLLNGPSQYTIANPAAATTALTNLAQGTYNFQLLVTDNDGLTSTDVVVVIVSPTPNQTPVANAGTDVTLTLPANSTTLTGTGSTDPDGNNTIASYTWTKVNGPSQFTLGDAKAATSSLGGLVEGVYTFKLTVIDNGGLSAEDIVTVTVNPAPNKAPVANAGSDISITLPLASIQLDGSTSSDPDGSIVSYTWVMTAGTGNLTIINAASSKPVLTDLVAGDYEFELTVTDNKGATAKDRVKISIAPAATPANKAPIANAGNDISITLPANSIQLDGSTSSDPDGTIVTYAWAMTAGAGNLTIINAASNKPILTDLVAGEYEFELTVTDNKGATAKDRVKISIAPVATPANKVPVADAGIDISITLPATTIQLDGSASKDADGSIVSYAWVMIAGSGNLTIINATSSKPVLSDLVAGEYEFELTLTDNKGASAKDRVKVSIAPAPNKLPVANAGKDIMIALPQNSVLLNGQQSSDEDGVIAAYTWKQVSGKTVPLDANGATAKVTKLEPGEYVFELNVADDRGAVSKDSVKVSVVNNMRYTESIVAYPNPTQGASTINIRCITDTLGMATITVMDQFGRPLEVHKRLKTLAYQEFPLSISHLRNGLYYVEVQIERKKRMVVRFTKR